MVRGVHKIYLSAILDLYDRRIVSYVISDHNDNPIVFDTFKASDRYIWTFYGIFSSWKWNCVSSKHDGFVYAFGTAYQNKAEDNRR